MQRDPGMTPAQLSQYLEIERLAEQQQQPLAAAQGDHFAGSWIERQADGTHRFIVATTRTGPQQGPAGVEFRHARYSFAELDAARSRLDALVERGGKVPAGVYSWYVDMPGNCVVVGMGKDGRQSAIDFVAASGANASLVRFVVEEEQARPLAP